MNERIAKLANECGFDVDKTGTFGNYSEMHRLEKFAELIVRECAMICDKVYEQNHNMQIRAGATFCREDIKQHFGVEE